MGRSLRFQVQLAMAVAAFIAELALPALLLLFYVIPAVSRADSWTASLVDFHFVHRAFSMRSRALCAHTCAALLSCAVSRK